MGRVEVIVFRHGETDWNREGRIQGATDIPLNADGFAQAEGLGRVLTGLGIQHVVSSDLSRSVATAEAVARALGVPVTFDAGLREARYGEGEGMLVDDMRVRLGSDFYRRWRSFAPEDWDIGFPGGETKRIVLDRARAAVLGCVRATGVGSIGVSTHGGVLRCLAHACLQPEVPTIAITNCVAYRFFVEVDGGGGARWAFDGMVPGTGGVPRAAERV